MKCLNGGKQVKENVFPFARNANLRHAQTIKTHILFGDDDGPGGTAQNGAFCWQRTDPAYAEKALLMRVAVPLAVVNAAASVEALGTDTAPVGNVNAATRG